MISKSFLCFFLILFPLCLTAAAGMEIPADMEKKEPADEICGEWYTPNKKTLIRMYRCGDRYCGRLVWMKEPRRRDGTPKRDSQNPDPDLRNRKLLGIQVVFDLEYRGDHSWGGGKIYDADTGKMYSAKVTIEGDTMRVRGYVGFSLLGRTMICKRKNAPDNKAGNPQKERTGYFRAEPQSETKGDSI